jgi:predicted HAD superfamily phosphohydrolase YqeG
VSAAYQQVVDPSDVSGFLRVLDARTVIFDVEPLVAWWDTDQTALVDGVTKVVRQVVAEARGVEVLVFATNSRRRLPAEVAGEDLQVLYMVSAGKPLRTAPYRCLPRPGVVVGDQVATDGVLAWRLGYSFLHYRLSRATVPLGPRIMGYLGAPLRPMLFTRGR